MTPSEKAYYKVVGIYCTTYKPIIEKQLKDKKGIKKIDINNITNTVIVEFDPLAITKHDIKARLEESGYKFIRAAQYCLDLISFFGLNFSGKYRDIPLLFTNVKE